MAREISRRLDIAQRTLTVDVEDDFGVVSHHTIPLAGDVCPLCKNAIPGTQGSPDVEASVTAILAATLAVTDGLIKQLEPMQHPDIQKVVQKAKAKRGN